VPQHVVRQLGDDNQHHKVHLHTNHSTLPHLTACTLSCICSIVIVVVVVVIVVIIVIVIGIVIVIVIAIGIGSGIGIIIIIIIIVLLLSLWGCAAASPACVVSCTENTITTIIKMLSSLC